MSEKKTNKKTLVIIITVIVILLIVAIIGGIFVFKNANSTNTEWGDYYYETLARESKKYEGKVPDEKGEYQTKEFDHYVDTNNVTLQFIQLKEEGIPIMVIGYEKNNYKQLNIYQARETENVGYKYTYTLSSYPSITDKEEQKPDGNYDVELLYNIEEQRYIWYTHRVDMENKESFTPIVSGEKSYQFTEEEMKTNQISEDETPILSKFEETFIVVDNIDKPIEIGDIHNIDEKVLKEHIKSAEKQYKDTSTIITEEIKTATQNKITELENKKEQIKVAQEEKAKKEAEEKAKAEEEARLKAEEEAKKGLKVGNYTLKYGSYKCDAEDSPAAGTYTIKQDGTFTYTNTWSNIKNEKYTDTASGTYTTYFSKGDDYDSTQSWIIKFNFSKYHSTYEPSNSNKRDFTAFDVTSDNKFQYRQSPGTFRYQGN